MSVDRSIAKSKMVRGYEVKRAPLGAYLQAIHALNAYPHEVMQKIFQTTDATQILRQVKALTTERLQVLIGKALLALEEPTLALLATLTGIDTRQLLEDEAIGLDGLAEILLAWFEVNGIANFMQTVAQIQTKWKSVTETTNNGYSG